MAFRSGKNGRIALGGTQYKIKKWSITERTQLQDTTNGESGGFGEYIDGVHDLDFNIDLDHNVGTNPFTTHFIPGTQFNAILYIDGIAAPNWSIYAIVEEVNESLDVRGLTTINLRGRGTSISGNSIINRPSS